MIELWEVLLISSGLALDVFAYSLWRGAMVAKLYKKDVIKMMLIFTGFQGGSIILGRILMSLPLSDASITSFNQLWIVFAALIFFGIGFYMIVRAFRKRKEVVNERGEGKIRYKAVVFWALLTSLDGLVAGVSFAFLPVSLLSLFVVTIVTTALAVLFGLITGYWLGCTIKNYLLLVGGFIVILGGVDVLSHYFIVW